MMCQRLPKSLRDEWFARWNHAGPPKFALSLARADSIRRGVNLQKFAFKLPHRFLRLQF